MKNIIKESQLRFIIENSVKNILNELHDRNKFSTYSTRIFNGDKTLTYLEQLVNNFTNILLYGNKFDFEKFANGIAILYNMAKEKVEYDKYNIKQIYQEYVNNGTEDEFWGNPDYYHYEYIDKYIGEYASTEKWDKYMPTPEKVKKLSDYFVEWLERETEYEIREYTEDKWTDYKVVSDFLSKNIY